MEGFATKLLAHSTNKQAKKIAWVHTDFEKHHWTNVIFKNKQNEEQTYSRYHQIVTVSVTVQKAFIKAFPLVKSFSKKSFYNPIDHEDIIKKRKAIRTFAFQKQNTINQHWQTDQS